MERTAGESKRRAIGWNDAVGGRVSQTGGIRHVRRSRRSEPANDQRSAGQRDRDRVLYSEAFQRLVGVTQVVTPTPAGLITHNRLTHSLKVAQVAYSIAEGVRNQLGDDAEAIGGVHLHVVEAAALGHDLGHPPFGHVGEQVLDRLALDAGLDEGFEGNAQSFRIAVRLEARKPYEGGLDLTAATRAALLKYPWFRAVPPKKVSGGTEVLDRDSLARKLADDQNFRREWKKFSAYRSDKVDFDEARAVAPESADGPPRQTAEAAIMDIADDITYALHDLEDFYQGRLLDDRAVINELDAYDRHWHNRDWNEADDNTEPGAITARLGKNLARDYGYFDRSLFRGAVRDVIAHFRSGVYTGPYTGARDQVAEMRQFTSDAIGEALGAVVITAEPAPGVQYVSLAAPMWHRLQVLKELTRSLIIERPQVAMLQIGQRRILSELGEALFGWSRTDRRRLPQRVAEALRGWEELTADEPSRIIIDYLASLTDHQAYELHRALTGQSEVVVTGSFLS